MKQKLKGGAEWDALGSGRGVCCYLKRAGVCADIKRGARRRLRQEAKAEVRAVDLLEFDINIPDGIVFPWEQAYGE